MAGNGGPPGSDTTDEGGKGRLKKVEGFDGTEFGVLGKDAIRRNEGLKNEQAEPVGIAQTAHTVGTLSAKGRSFGLRFPEFENEFDLPAQAVDQQDLVWGPTAARHIRDAHLPSQPA